MLDEPIDLAIVGAGPAGMAAALTARSAGLSVVVLDEQAAPGGQIYRAVTSATAGRCDVLGPDYAEGRELARDFEASGARHEYGAAVWQVTPEGRIHYLQAGQSRMIEPGKVILCTGAMERPFPIPGWTLPGVLTAGAAQILLKTGDVVPADPVVLAGCGPLLYLLAWQYLRAGVPIKAFIETTSADDYLRALAKLPAAMIQWRLLAKGLSLKAALHRSGVPIFSGARELRIEGGKSAEAIEFRTGNRQHRVEARVFLLHQGVVPNTQITWSLRASHVWDPVQLCWTPQASVAGELIGLPGIFIAGDGAGIIGAEASMLSGRVAALAALRALRGSHADAQFESEAAALLRDLRRATAARPFLDALYRPRAEFRIPADEVIVCRCEEVTAGEIRKHVRSGCLGPNQLKSFTRCGMGPCQGRQCGITATEIIAAERGVAASEAGYQRVRPPIKPISLGELGGL